MAAFLAGCFALFAGVATYLRHALPHYYYRCRYRVPFLRSPRSAAACLRCYFKRILQFLPVCLPFQFGHGCLHTSSVRSFTVRVLRADYLVHSGYYIGLQFTTPQPYGFYIPPFRVYRRRRCTLFCAMISTPFFFPSHLPFHFHVVPRLPAR